MEAMKVSEIVKAVGGKLLCGDENAVIDHVCIDSREADEGALFVPIIGEKVDAHKFIPQVFSQGAGATFTSRKEIAVENCPHIYVENTEKALGALSVYYKAKFNIPFIGITGSVGKTSTKEMIAAALETKYNVLKTAGNQNSNIGVPLTLFRVEKQHEIAVIEMGISDFNEMSELADFVHPDTAVVTNIGVAHLAQFKTQENTMKEKLMIAKHFHGNQLLYLNGDDPLLKTLPAEANVRFFGTGDQADFQGKNIRIENGRQCFTFEGEDYKEEVSMLQLGLHNVYNGVVAMAIALHYGIEPNESKKGIEAYKGIAMRQQVHHLDNQIKIIDDTYNASPDSIKSGIKVLQSLDNPGRKIACLADVLELGQDENKLHYETGQFIAEHPVDQVVTVGPLMKHLASGINDCNPQIVTHSFDTNQEAIDYLETVVKQGDALLCKGSRGMHQEEVVEALIKHLNKEG